MSKFDVIRAWKDPEYRASLSEDQRALLPPHPAGLMHLTDEELENTRGNAGGGNHFTNPKFTCIIKCIG